MLSVKLQIFMILAFLAALLFLIQQVRTRKLELRYTLSWLLLDIVLLILAVFPSLLLVMSSAMGIYAPVNMIFFCGFAFSLFIIYTLTAAISKMAEEIKRLAQRIALLEKQAEASEANLSKIPDSCPDSPDPEKAVELEKSTFPDEQAD